MRAEVGTVCLCHPEPLGPQRRCHMGMGTRSCSSALTAVQVRLSLRHCHAIHRDVEPPCHHRVQPKHHVQHLWDSGRERGQQWGQPLPQSNDPRGNPAPLTPPHPPGGGGYQRAACGDADSPGAVGGGGQAVGTLALEAKVPPVEAAVPGSGPRGAAGSGSTVPGSRTPRCCGQGYITCSRG